MGMIINTNIMAINAQRNLSTTNVKLGRALEKLSSGLRINRAADAAAGLAISDKIRSPTRGMRLCMRHPQVASARHDHPACAPRQFRALQPGIVRPRDMAMGSGDDLLMHLPLGIVHGF